MALLAGGMITAPLLSVFVIPAVYLVLRRRGVAIGAERTKLIERFITGDRWKTLNPSPRPSNGVLRASPGYPKGRGGGLT